MTALTLSSSAVGRSSGLGHSNTKSTKITNATTSSKNTARTVQNSSGKTSNATLTNKSSKHLASVDTLIHVNPYLNDYIDCIENLPNKIQLLLTELRSVDVQVKGNNSKESFWNQRSNTELGSKRASTLSCKTQ